MIKEIRNNITEYSFDSEKRTIEGYAVIFNSKSALLRDKNGNPFYEFIDSNAITQETIDSSDILFLLDHNSSRGVLARSNCGVGSLKLELDEIGLKFSFELPDTALSQEVREGIKRGDINGCSFAFTVKEDSFERRNDGNLYRTINKIDRLFDCSVVYQAAYPETSVDLRSLQEFLDNENNQNIINPMTENKRSKEEILEEINKLNEELRSQEEETEKEQKEEDKEEKSVEETDETKEEKSQEEDSEKEETEEQEEKNCDNKEEDKRNLKQDNLYIKEEKENRNNNIFINNNHSTMNKFSILKTINDVVNNRSINDVAQNVIAEGRKAANEAGLTANGQIVLPFTTEKRYEANPNGIIASTEPSATVVGMGGEIVPTDTFDFLGALRDRMILTSLGARMLSLTSNVEQPIYSGANCHWESELGEAQDGAGTFKTVKLSPKRLTASLAISKQLLNQTSASVEAKFRDDLVACIAEKLQQTIFSADQGTDTKPEGLFYGVSTDATDFEFEDAVNMEERLESLNVFGEKKYVMSPATKAKLRVTKVDEGSGRFVMENNSVLGIDALSTSSVVPNGLILGNWENLYIANFGAIDITIDNISRAKYGQIEIIVNAYFDYAVVRPEGFIKKILK